MAIRQAARGDHRAVVVQPLTIWIDADACPRKSRELLLRASGFKRFAVHGGFEEQPLERDDQEMVWTAWKD